MTTMREQCRCVMHSESDRIVWDGGDCPLHYDQEATMAEDAAQATIKELRRDLALTREELEYLRKENDRLEQVLQDPLLLKGLEAAWEAAEQAPECRKGDVLIVPGSWGGYTIWEAARDSQLRVARILSRAPREPWADLADLLRAWDAEPADADADGMAKWFHERGVRVTGGGDDE